MLRFVALSLISAPLFAQTIPGLIELKSVRVSEQTSQAQVILEMDRAARFSSGFLKNPPRFYVDLADAHATALPARPNGSIVQQVRVGQLTPTVARIVVDLKDESSVSVKSEDGVPRIVLSVTPKAAVASAPPVRSNISLSTLRSADFGLVDNTPEVRLSLDRAAEFSSGYLRQPDRFYVDLKNTVPSSGAKITKTISGPLVRGLRVARFDLETTRVVLDLDASTEAAIQPTEGSTDLVIRVRNRVSQKEALPPKPALTLLFPAPSPRQAEPAPPIPVEVPPLPAPAPTPIIQPSPILSARALAPTPLATPAPEPLAKTLLPEPKAAETVMTLAKSEAGDPDAFQRDPRLGTPAADAQAYPNGKVTQRGFLETRALAYAQSAPNDSARIVADALLRWEGTYAPNSWLTINGSLDARTDSHRQVSRDLQFDVNGRNIQRPSISMRRMSAILHHGGFSTEIGRQFIRWGKTDILNPNDRFAPKDYLSSVVDTDFLGVNAVRTTFESEHDSLDLVWQPLFTPSRTPLLNQRWTVLPPQAAGLAIRDGGARYPGGSQYGARWNHVGSGYEYSLSYFAGNQNLPSFDAKLLPELPPTFQLQRFYPRIRAYGADMAIPLTWFTLKSEASYITSSTPGAQEYALYVVQVERMVKEWSFVGGYAGSYTTREPASPLQFAADRGYAKSFVGRAALTIDANRSIALETAIRDAGSFLRFEYSQAHGQHWRTVMGAAWIRGNMTDFLGQYKRNSYGSLAIRYSF
ncbi:MAG: AMIN domain-containing protein [Acidobacteriota bacterium]